MADTLALIPNAWPGMEPTWSQEQARRHLCLESGSRPRLHGVRMAGDEDDATRLFPAFDAFMFSSRTDGMPIVLFEAMAAGVAVVVSSVRGVPDVWRP